MSEESDFAQGPPDHGGRRRRRRRRRRRGPGGDEGGFAQDQHQGGNDWGDDVLLADGSGAAAAEDGAPRRGPPPRGARRQAYDVGGPVISTPSSGRNPWKKRSTRALRAMPSSVAGRRRRLTRAEVDSLGTWIERMPDALVAALYRGLGGQPNRVSGRDRMIQLAVRAIAQGNRLSALVKQVHERDRKALSALLQSGGIAHADEFHRELSASYGGLDRDWARVMNGLADRGVIAASPEAEGHFFYLVPEPLVDGLLEALTDEMALPTFNHEEMRVMEHKPFCPPLDFSITTLATYVDQVHPRLTQRHDIYRHDQEAMDAFFAQIWEPDSDLFTFHLNFLMMHGMVELRGEYLSLNSDVVEEWLRLEPEDQRDLVFRALEKRIELAEWVLWAVHGAGGDWVAERPLMALYRRWKRGEDWRDRFQRGQFQPARTNDRESWSFSPLVRCGLLELGQWGQEKFYRVSARGKQLLEPAPDEGFRQFYLTPTFEIMAPAGIAPILLFRIGELADLVGCDRANTYKITETSVARAMERGWRRDDALQFLRDNSQIGLPDNVEATLKGWIGHRGDVEFHDLTLLTIHRSQIRHLEGNKRLKPYLLHRFAPGMYAVDRARREELADVLADCGFDTSRDVRSYPGDPAQVEARQKLRRMVTEAREAAVDPVMRGASLIEPDALLPVPGTRVAAEPRSNEPEPPPQVTQEEVRSIIDQAIAGDLDVEMVYVTRNGQKTTCRVQPQRLTFKAESPVLVGLDRDANDRKTFMLDKVERLRIVER